MRIHLIEGDAGCRFAVEHGAAAVIVDALRASATAAALLEAGAADVCVVREVAEAFALKAFWPDALLFGERGGVPPEGFDFGNSPAEATHARNRRVIFTTTTGAGRLLAAWGAPAVLMASVVNSTAVARYFEKYPVDEAVIIPAGLMSDPSFDAREDWAAAAWLAAHLFESGGHTPGEGYERYLQTKAPGSGHPALRARGLLPGVAHCRRGVSWWIVDPGCPERNNRSVTFDQTESPDQATVYRRFS